MSNLYDKRLNSFSRHVKLIRRLIQSDIDDDTIRSILIVFYIPTEKVDIFNLIRQ